MADIPVSEVSVGIVTGDSTRALPVGAKLKFEPRPVIGDIPEGAATLKNWDFFKGMLIHIAFVDGESHRVEGSGVVVAPGVALCATHVIAPHLEHLTTGSVVAMCFGTTPHGLQIWDVRKVTTAPNNDIAILGIECNSALPPDLKFFQSIITTRTPAVGEQLTICGFRASESSFQRNSNGVYTSGEAWICKGAVIETFPLGRDRSMIPWPALAVEVSSPGGLSGGPVYDSQGLVVGLLCSSIECGDGMGISYVSLLWPALPIPFEATWPNGIYSGANSLLELDPRICVIDKREAITLTNQSGGRVWAEYQPWS